VNDILKERGSNKGGEITGENEFFLNPGLLGEHLSINPKMGRYVRRVMVLIGCRKERSGAAPKIREKSRENKAEFLIKNHPLIRYGKKQQEGLNGKRTVQR